MRPIALAAPLALTLAGACGGCAPAASRGVGSTASTAAAPDVTPSPPPAGQARFFWRPGMRLGHPRAEQLLSASGSPRIERPELYEAFWRDVAPRLQAWAAEPCVGIDPNFAAALLAKESGFDPAATSAVPAIGLAQVTETADADLLARARGVPCMGEALTWPRHPVVHSALVTQKLADSLIASGAVNARTEYLLDPLLSTRSALFQLRLAADTWLRHDEYAPFARRVLNGGRALSEGQVLELVTVSYNQGPVYVHGLLGRHGAGWKEHLNAESRDYLERVRAYAVVFQRAPGGR
jgi:hypothetical protein